MMRRKLGGMLSDPILSLNSNDELDSIIFTESDNKAALKTRAAALMFIGRNDLDLHTKVIGCEIWIMKDRDDLGRTQFIDIRPRD